MTFSASLFQNSGLWLQERKRPSWHDTSLQIPVVAAEQFGEGGADGAPVPVDHQLQHVLVYFDHHGCHLLSRREEDDGEKSHLKLWTHADEGAADGLHQALPAEL